MHSRTRTHIHTQLHTNTYCLQPVNKMETIKFLKQQEKLQQKNTCLAKHCIMKILNLYLKCCNKLKISLYIFFFIKIQLIIMLVSVFISGVNAFLILLFIKYLMRILSNNKKSNNYMNITKIPKFTRNICMQMAKHTNIMH